MIPQPNLYVLGPPRTGTTSLSRWLTATPNVDMSRPKEPAFHVRDLPMTDRIDDLDAYLAGFDPSATVRYRCDATPWYLYSVKAAASIHAMEPNARLVVRLRNPVDMLASLHNHHRFVGIEREASFEKALFTPRRPHETDFRHNLDYLAVARVGEQVQRFVDTFPTEHIYFMRFDAAARDPQASHVGLLEWLDLDPKPLAEYRRLNTARRERVEHLRPITEWMTDRRRPHAVRAAGYRIRRANTIHGRSRVSVPLCRRILDELRNDIELLSELSRQDLIGQWMQKGNRTAAEAG